MTDWSLIWTVVGSIAGVLGAIGGTVCAVAVVANQWDNRAVRWAATWALGLIGLSALLAAWALHELGLGSKGNAYPTWWEWLLAALMFGAFVAAGWTDPRNLNKRK
jgi:hypothetical protein